MSPFYVVAVEIDTAVTVYGSFHEQARAEELAARFRRNLKDVPRATVWVAPVHLPEVRIMRDIYRLDEPVVEVTLDQVAAVARPFPEPASSPSVPLPGPDTEAGGEVGA